MMNETEYHLLADAELDTLLEPLEEADGQALLEVEYQDGVMTIQLPSGQQFILSKHVASRQLWLSSPLSGGLHFSCDAASRQWKLSDGRSLPEMLAHDLQTLGVPVRF